MKKIVLIICLAWAATFVSAQNIRPLDINVNQEQGTFIVREIRKDPSINNLSKLTVRIFMPFFKQLKGRGPNSIQLFVLDSARHSLNDTGTIDLTLKRGWHTIDINYPYDPPFSAFQKIQLRFRKKRHYIIDIYLPVPFPNIYH